eukprot:2889899-Pyramimonas_sp.AAC.1
MAYDKQRAFRMIWAKTKLESLKVERCKTRDQTIDAGMSGEYLSFYKTWEAEGLDQAGLDAAEHFWASAVELWKQKKT